MKARMFVGALASVLVVFAVALGPVSAGGPICKVPPMCGPPPVCGPQPYCGPPPCPPPCGEPNPLAKVFTGAFRLVTGVVALPFKLVDRMIDALDCSPNTCGPPRPMCGPPPCAPPVCGPPPCAPPVCGPPPCGPPVCGPVKCGPPASYGMAPQMRPTGYAPRRMSPMSKKTDSVLPSTLMASPGEGVFGSYW